MGTHTSKVMGTHKRGRAGLLGGTHSGMGTHAHAHASHTRARTRTRTHAAGKCSQQHSLGHALQEGHQEVANHALRDLDFGDGWEGFGDKQGCRRHALSLLRVPACASGRACAWAYACVRVCACWCVRVCACAYKNVCMHACVWVRMCAFVNAGASMACSPKPTHSIVSSSGFQAISISWLQVRTPKHWEGLAARSRPVMDCMHARHMPREGRQARSTSTQRKVGVCRGLKI